MQVLQRGTHFNFDVPKNIVFGVKNYTEFKNRSHGLKVRFDGRWVNVVVIGMVDAPAISNDQHLRRFVVNAERLGNVLTHISVSQ